MAFPFFASLPLWRCLLLGHGQYDILEYDPLLDSSNMGIEDWVKIATDVEKHYHQYDAFIILHGTDTMAFTASALSFMFEYLEKPVIITGSQIPLSRVRNDAADNLMGALTLAAHYEIPEVCLYFHHNLLRGNRTSKVDASGFEAFKSHNYPPLATVGIEINVNWSVIRPNTLDDDGEYRPFRASTKLDSNVGILRLFPGLPDHTLENFLKPPMRGLVLQTFGSGNAPSARKRFVELIKEATARGMVIVNVTQCEKGFVSSDYEAGFALKEAGVVAGADMTPEAALTKLIYLLGKDLPVEEVRHRMGENIRGELTVLEVDRFSLRSKSMVKTVFDAIRDKVREFEANAIVDHKAKHSPSKDIQRIQEALIPVLMCSAAALGDLALLRDLFVESPNGADVFDYDKRYPLHLAASEGKVQAVQFLLDKGANPNVIDRWGNTPLDDAIRGGHTQAINLLKGATKEK
ncbi:asparaginase [Balamuthia mandrillaris]